MTEQKIKELEHLEVSWKLGAKAWQNVNASVMGFDKMLQMGDSFDPIIFPSLFYWAVIRYVKPFLKSGTSKSCYRLKRISSYPDFNKDIHQHLVNIRHTLIAHDDFTEIEPKLLMFGPELEKGFIAPQLIEISNKCVSSPKEIEMIEILKVHAEATAQAIFSELEKDLNKLRGFHLKYPKDMRRRSSYSKSEGKSEIDSEGKVEGFTGSIDKSWLDMTTPSFIESDMDYHYETANIKFEFNGPEEIISPSGAIITITPDTIKD
jgi:hypothetical protein